MITLVLGGARSGKSAFAERLAASEGGSVTYVATAAIDGDPDFEARVRRHRSRRPAGWSTAEPGRDLVGFLAGEQSDATLLVDSLGAWLAQFEDFQADKESLCAALAGRVAHTVVVSDEVGMSVHPSTMVGRRFRDALGEVNQAVSKVADHAYLIVAGRPLELGSGW
jgi:adenosylcobinamide kinase / adenosylcobinamide-phosphate guanylyltransferase